MEGKKDMKKNRPLWKTVLGVYFGLACFGAVIAATQAPNTGYIIIAVILGVVCSLLLYTPKSEQTPFPPLKHNDTSKVAPTSSYQIRNNVIYRSDGEAIQNGDISSLIQLGYEDAVKNEKESKNIALHRTEREDNLCFQFMMNHSEEITKHTNSLEEAVRVAYAEKDFNKKIELQQEAITLWEKEKKWFYKSKGGTIYFQDYYEHLHSSHNDDFSYIDSVVASLDYNLYLRNDIIPHMKQIITSSGGILQKDIYKYFPDMSKSSLQQLIRDLENSNIVIRTKKSNSYFLSLNN